MRFIQRYHLDRHKRVHSGEKPYQCDRCHQVGFRRFSRCIVFLALLTRQKHARFFPCRTFRGLTVCCGIGACVQLAWLKRKTSSHRIHLPTQLPGAPYSLPTTVWQCDIPQSSNTFSFFHFLIPFFFFFKSAVISPNWQKQNYLIVDIRYHGNNWTEQKTRLLSEHLWVRFGSAASCEQLWLNSTSRHAAATAERWTITYGPHCWGSVSSPMWCCRWKELWFKYQSKNNELVIHISWSFILTRVLHGLVF